MHSKELKQSIKELEKEIQKLETNLTNKDIINNPTKLKKFSKLLPKKQDELSLKEAILNTEKELVDARNLIKNETDKEMVSLAEEELIHLEKKLILEKDKLEKFLNKDDQDKYSDCIVEIRAGTGGEEANLFASDLARMYLKYAESKKWKTSVLSKNQTGTGGFKELIFQVTGDDAYSNLKSENGVHRVQRVPSTESSGRIHTSASSVVVYPLIEEEESEINPEDLKIDVYRSSGPGGQSVNTTDSAVRITHLPTETIVTCQDEKSQHKNKKKALSLLKSKLHDLEKAQQEEGLSKIRKSAIKTGDRSAKIRTYNFPQSRVTDHRIKKSWHNLKGMLDGDLDKMIEELKSQI